MAGNLLCDHLSSITAALWLRQISNEQILECLNVGQVELRLKQLENLVLDSQDIPPAARDRILRLEKLIDRLRRDSVFVRALLVNRLVAASQLNEALEIQQSLGYASRVGLILVELGYLSRDTDARVLKLENQAITRENQQLKARCLQLLQKPQLLPADVDALLAPFSTWLDNLPNETLERYLKVTERRRESKRFLPVQRAPTKTEEAPPIPGFERVAAIGQGAMGNVYKYLQRSLQRYVAIKFLKLQETLNESMFMRFKREAQLAASLNHPNIVQIFDVGSADGVPYFVMEFVAGSTLNAIVDRHGPLPEAQCVSIACQAVSALAHAQKQGVIHRDIKPANMMMTGEGQLKICDFGLAKSELDAVHLTGTGLALGTPHYMSPEQCSNGAHVDARSDIYSLGASLYRIATGHVPYDGETSMNIMFALTSHPFPDPRVRYPAILLSAGFVALLKRMMEKDPADRYPSFVELQIALDALQPGAA